ncbi:MAG: exodeoxyribonuclease VII small subunit [Lachnospiraceae bacterium]|nr:exodeoxyribonuclease VII small subunit [Lachnospiraceae bacterium]
MAKKTATQEPAEQSANFEEQMELLDELVEKMQDPDTTLAESFESYKQGMNLVQSLNGMIDRMEKEVIVLSGTDEEADDEE